MQSVAFVVPVLPGKAEQHRREMEEITGPRRDELQNSRKKLGIKREAAWHQETPDGTVTVVYIEADDLEAAMGGMGRSDDPFDVWFRESVKDIHGIDLAEPFPPPVPILDVSF